MRFYVGQKVVKVLSIMGIQTATRPEAIVEAGEGWVRLERDEHMKYNAMTGQEIDPVIPGCNSWLIHLDGE